MECKKCGAKWETGKKMSESLTVCPFCRESLSKKEEPKFYDNSRDALAAIMKMYGAEVLLGKLTSHFPDFAPDVSKNVKKLVYAVYENDAAKVLKNNLSASQADRERAVKVAIQKLTEAFIVPDMAETIIYEFTAALGWQVSKPAPPPEPTKQPTDKPTETRSSSQQQAPGLTLLANARNQTATGIATEILQGKTRNLQFGSYKWRVLEVQSDAALMITEDIVEKRPYNEKYTAVTWETCTLRQYLNGDFLQKFTGEERGKIIETRISNPNNLWYGIPGGSDTMDKIFLLSLKEVDRYFGNSGDYQQKRRKSLKNGNWIAHSDGYGFSNAHDIDRQVKFTNEACWWWLRSPGGNSFLAAFVDYDGIVYVHGSFVSNDGGGVRPAFWLNLKS